MLGNVKYVALEIIARISYDATTQQIVSLFDAKRQLQNIRLILGLKLIPLACTVLSTLFVLPLNVSKSPWNSIFFLWFHIDVTCATASSAKINLLVLFKQNTYFGSRSQTRWWNGVSLISNSSDSFTNSVPMNLRIISTIRINNQTHSRFAATENLWKNLMNSI